MLTGEQLREELERLLDACRDREDVPTEYVEQVEEYLAAEAYEEALYFVLYGE